MTTRKRTKYGFEIVGTVGDVNFPENGGGEVYKDGAGFTLEYVDPPPDDIDFDDKDTRWTIYRVALEKGVPDGGSYKSAAKTAGMKPSELKAAFESDDPMVRAGAYAAWAAHYGWEEFDPYPLVLDKKAVEDRYDTEIGSGEDEDEPEGEEQEDEEDFDEGMEDGYIISDVRSGSGVIVTQANKRVGKYKDKDEALDAIDERMEKEKFYPNIYYVNERGNTDLIDVNGKIIESRV
jgi:hypothetical protein